jgi:GNAT superfamily N-acetyltransferase
MAQPATLPTVSLVPDPSPALFAALFIALDATSRDRIGPADPVPLAISLRDADGTVIGGLWGGTMFRWLQVQILVVPEALRGRGLGTRLVRAAEQEARRRGCLGACVDTFSFQATGFYRLLGYSEFARLEDCPPGYARLYFRRRFDDAMAAPSPPVCGATVPLAAPPG